ncbi:MAG: energy transducer TonB [Gammaproteobacteria bacterium]|nr:energy transducer TonB [Gammaproteobacteria bacterium]
MLKPSWLFVLLAGVSQIAHADFFEGMSAYRHQDFSKAQLEFSELLPLGNGAAVFNLAMMAYQGQGEPVDPIKTAALLTLAAQLREQKAGPLAEKLMAALSTSEQAAVKTQVAHYQKQLMISPAQRGWAHRTHDPKVDKAAKWLKKVPPVFPQKARLNGHFGAVEMLALLDKDGSVLFVDSNETLDRDLFSKAAKNSFQKWQFQPMEQRQIYRMTYDFIYSLSVDEQRNTRLSSWKSLKQAGLLEMVQQDSAAHQFAFGKILQRLEQSTDVVFYPDASLVATQALPDRMIYQVAKEPQRIDPIIEHGAVVIEVNALNRIETVQADSAMSIEKDTDFSTLKGVLMPETVAAGWYKLAHLRDKNGVKSNYLWDLQRVPLEHYSGYWISMAARNGDLTAQRELASRRSDWRRYLQQKNDPKALLWAGMLNCKTATNQKLKSCCYKPKLLVKVRQMN